MHVFSSSKTYLNTLTVSPLQEDELDNAGGTTYRKTSNILFHVTLHR